MARALDRRCDRDRDPTPSPTPRPVSGRPRPSRRTEARREIRAGPVDRHVVPAIGSRSLSHRRSSAAGHGKWSPRPDAGSPRTSRASRTRHRRVGRTSDGRRREADRDRGDGARRAHDRPDVVAGAASASHRMVAAGVARPGRRPRGVPPAERPRPAGVHRGVLGASQRRPRRPRPARMAVSQIQAGIARARGAGMEHCRDRRAASAPPARRGGDPISAPCRRRRSRSRRRGEGGPRQHRAEMRRGAPRCDSRARRQRSIGNGKDESRPAAGTPPAPPRARRPARFRRGRSPRGDAGEGDQHRDPVRPVTSYVNRPTVGPWGPTDGAAPGGSGLSQEEHAATADRADDRRAEAAATGPSRPARRSTAGSTTGSGRPAPHRNFRLGEDLERAERDRGERQGPRQRPRAGPSRTAAVGAGVATEISEIAPAERVPAGAGRSDAMEPVRIRRGPDRARRGGRREVAARRVGEQQSRGCG